jgi:hypothetical protein
MPTLTAIVILVLESPGLVNAQARMSRMKELPLRAEALAGRAF